MKNWILIFGMLFVNITLFGQVIMISPDTTIKYIAEFPNGEESINIVGSLGSDKLQLTATTDFYKYEILNILNHDLIHFSENEGKVCEIDKSVIQDGKYILKVYTDEMVITSVITISDGINELVSLL